MKNFDYLKEYAYLEDLYGYCSMAEAMQLYSPDMSALNARRALEYIVRALYEMKGIEIGERTSLFELVDGEPFKEFCGFVSKSYFLVSAILCTLGCYCAEGFNEGGVLGAVHYVGDAVCGDVNKLGCFVGVKVGVEVGALADRCSCRFDGVVAEVRSLIVCEVVSLFNLAREGEAEPLFAVLTVVLVCSLKVFAKCDVCHFRDRLSFSSVLL